MVLGACRRSAPWCLLALRADASSPKKPEERRAEGPLVAALEQYKETRQHPRKAAQFQDIETGVLPKVCKQLNTKVASHQVAQKLLVLPVEQLLLREIH